MTTVLGPRPTASRTPVAGPAPRPARLRWSARLMRRGAALVWLTTATYLAVELLVYRSAYPDAASREHLVELSGSTAVRMLQGTPRAVDTPAGYAIWDGGWLLSIIVASWALLTAVRLTRGEEDSGRAELALSRPLTPAQALATHLTTLTAAAAGTGSAAAAALIALGAPAAGAALWGAGLAVFTATFAALGAAAAQLAEPRRRAVSLGLGMLAAAFLLRVAGNSAHSRAWLSAVQPFGWLERLHAFSGGRAIWLLPPVLAFLTLAAAALVLTSRRDAGAAVIRPAAAHRSSTRLLAGAVRFGWRLTTGSLLAWALGLAVTAGVFGLMTRALIDFIDQDETYRRLLESMGVDVSVPAVGYLSYLGGFFALPFATFLGWRLGAARQEEAEGRLDNLLARGVVRERWLAGTAALALLAGTILVTVTTAGLLLGTRLVGAPVSVRQVVEPMAGTVPVLVLFTGLAVLVFGLAPRLTVALPVTLAVLGYLLETFGTSLHWPSPVVGISPFHHLARLPAQPMTATAVAVLTGLGLAAAAGGVIAFGRRDLRGA